mgnify:CR=1 FL=1
MHSHEVMANLIERRTATPEDFTEEQRQRIDQGLRYRLSNLIASKNLANEDCHYLASKHNMDGEFRHVITPIERVLSARHIKDEPYLYHKDDEDKECLDVAKFKEACWAHWNMLGNKAAQAAVDPIIQTAFKFQRYQYFAAEGLRRNDKEGRE